MVNIRIFKLTLFCFKIYSIVSLRSKRCGKKCPIHNGKRIPFHACGGVLLTRSVVLTAAHCCIDEKTAKRDRKRRKSTKIHEAWAGGVMVHDLLQKRKIKRMVVHPKADGAQQYDLCMLKVSIGKKFTALQNIVNLLHA